MGYERGSFITGGLYGGDRKGSNKKDKKVSSETQREMFPYL